jgi:hypothetical protein
MVHHADGLTQAFRFSKAFEGTAVQQESKLDVTITTGSP